jgi:uncharacterized protein YndB with AHSA1/START domain
MQTRRFSIVIDAPRERVWDVMLGDATYREWTTAFTEGSHYVGRWEPGEEIRFLDGTGNGMVSRIAEARRPEFVSIEHLGLIKAGREDRESDEVKPWAGVHENYTFVEAGAGATAVHVDMDLDDAHADMFDDMWPKALERLKVVAERR